MSMTELHTPALDAQGARHAGWNILQDLEMTIVQARPGEVEAPCGLNGETCTEKRASMKVSTNCIAHILL